MLSLIRTFCVFLLHLLEGLIAFTDGHLSQWSNCAKSAEVGFSKFLYGPLSRCEAESYTWLLTAMEKETFHLAWELRGCFVKSVLLTIEPIFILWTMGWSFSQSGEGIYCMVKGSICSVIVVHGLLPSLITDWSVVHPKSGTLLTLCQSSAAPWG